MSSTGCALGSNWIPGLGSTDRSQSIHENALSAAGESLSSPLAKDTPISTQYEMFVHGILFVLICCVIDNYQILHMIERERGLTQRLYANSLGTGGIMQSPSGASGAVADIDDSWPFMCVGIGMTKHAIDALRSGALTKDVNKAKSCMAVLHEFHHACFYCFSR